MTFQVMIEQVASGIGATLTLFFTTLIFSLPLGLLIAFGRLNGWAPFARFATEEGGLKSRLAQAFMPIRLVIQFIISVLRGTPLMLQLIVVFYGPYYVFGIHLSTNWRVAAAIIGFSINYAAYFAEIFRAGIQSVPVGHHEAAKVLGYSKRQTFMKIVFPQMCKNVLPPVTNEIITLVKDTSLAFVIVYPEMFTISKQVAAAQTTIIPLFVAGAFYYIFNFVVAIVMSGLEKKMSYYR